MSHQTIFEWMMLFLAWLVMIFVLALAADWLDEHPRHWLVRKFHRFAQWLGGER